MVILLKDKKKIQHQLKSSKNKLLKSNKNKLLKVNKNKLLKVNKNKLLKDNKIHLLKDNKINLLKDNKQNKILRIKHKMFKKLLYNHQVFGQISFFNKLFFINFF